MLMECPHNSIHRNLPCKTHFDCNKAFRTMRYIGDILIPFWLYHCKLGGNYALCCVWKYLASPGPDAWQRINIFNDKFGLFIHLNVCKVLHIIFFFHNKAKLSLFHSNFSSRLHKYCQSYPKILMTKSKYSLLVHTHGQACQPRIRPL